MKIETIKNAYKFLVIVSLCIGIVCWCFNTVKGAVIGSCFLLFSAIPALIWNAQNDYYIEYEVDNEAAEETDQR